MKFFIIYGILFFAFAFFVLPYSLAYSITEYADFRQNQAFELVKEEVLIRFIQEITDEQIDIEQFAPYKFGVGGNSDFTLSPSGGTGSISINDDTGMRLTLRGRNNLKDPSWRRGCFEDKVLQDRRNALTCGFSDERALSALPEPLAEAVRIVMPLSDNMLVSMVIISYVKQLLRIEERARTRVMYGIITFFGLLFWVLVFSLFATGGGFSLVFFFYFLFTPLFFVFILGGAFLWLIIFTLIRFLWGARVGSPTKKQKRMLLWTAALITVYILALPYLFFLAYGSPRWS
jgi:hypothetical protein